MSRKEIWDCAKSFAGVVEDLDALDDSEYRKCKDQVVDEVCAPLLQDHRTLLVIMLVLTAPIAI